MSAHVSLAVDDGGGMSVQLEAPAGGQALHLEPDDARELARALLHAADTSDLVHTRQECEAWRRVARYYLGGDFTDAHGPEACLEEAAACALRLGQDNAREFAAILDPLEKDRNAFRARAEELAGALMQAREDRDAALARAAAAEQERDALRRRMAEVAADRDNLRLEKESPPADGPRGRLAFDTYAHAVGGVNAQGNPIPPWDNLPPHIQGAWCAAAAAVLRSQEAEEPPELARLGKGCNRRADCASAKEGDHCCHDEHCEDCHGR